MMILIVIIVMIILIKVVVVVVVIIITIITIMIIRRRSGSRSWRPRAAGRGLRRCPVAFNTHLRRLLLAFGTINNGVCVDNFGPVAFNINLRWLLLAFGTVSDSITHYIYVEHF